MHCWTRTFARSCFSDHAARVFEKWLRARLSRPAWLAEWLARLLIGIVPVVAAFVWPFARPSRPVKVWAAMYVAALVLVLWSTRQQFRKLDESEHAVDALVAPESLNDLLDEKRRWRNVQLLAAPLVPVLFAGVVDWIWRGSRLDIAWLVTVGWTVFWIVGSFWGTRGSLWRIAKRLRDLPNLKLVRHAPARTPGLQVLRGFADQFWKRLSLVIVMITAPLAWGTILAINHHPAHAAIHHHSAHAGILLAIDLITFLGLVVWLAQGAYPADQKLTAIARNARDGTLNELRAHLPKTAHELVTPEGQRAINLYDQIAHEPVDVDRRWRWIGLIASLAPTLAAIATVLSTAPQIHL